MNKHMKNLLPLCFAAAFSFSLMADSNALPLYTAPAPVYGTDSGISPQSDDIVWRYKDVNGKTYKRKYNRTTRKWIGDWILIP